MAELPAPIDRDGEASPRAFVTGWPVDHSRSPVIHRYWLTQFGLAGRYDRIGVPPEEIGAFFERLRHGGFVGGNVTLPHKVAAFEAADRRDGAAEAIGAVNALWFEGGALVGGNTDAYGFSANLDERLAGWGDAGTAVVLGAGGAARAVIHALLERGIGTVHLVNRTVSRAEELAARFGPRVVPAGEAERDRLLARADLLVNTVPPGQAAKPPDLSVLPDHAMVSDIVYVPLLTPLLAGAEERGLRTADGLGMLLHQAVPAFERWFGRRPTVSQDLREAVVADIGAGA